MINIQANICDIQGFCGLACAGRLDLHFSRQFTFDSYDDPEILEFADDEGKTVAHVMAEEGYQFGDREIWQWAAKHGLTVAHEMAS